MDKILDDFLEKYKEFIPENFDWEFYINYYSDIRSAGLNNEKLAKYHYINWGRKENRKYCCLKEKLSYNKIFQIGFNKCGTLSLWNLFHNYSSINAIHWDNGSLAEKIYKNIYSDTNLPLDSYEDYIYFGDMECFIQEDSRIKYIQIYKDFFDILDINYPESLFILNTRNIDNWIRSRLNHNFLQPIYGEIKYIGLFKKVYNTNKISEIIKIWKNDWIEHHNNIKKYFHRNTHRLFVFNIEKDSPDKLFNYLRCRNIKFQINTLPHDNKTK
ncbi:hypothetical protein EB118_25650, partial [bacterium]|nr:hypothetical protein [bacterium]